ncbi:MAG TPA: serine--tRNA ligase [Chitinophagaceae bacterium]
MIDIALIRNSPEAVKEAMRTRNEPDNIIDEILKLDTMRRENLRENELLREQRNILSKEIPNEKDAAQRTEKVNAVKKGKERINELEIQLREIEPELNKLLSSVPNMPGDKTPVGLTEEDNKIISEHGTKRNFDFAPKPHWDIDICTKQIDFERGVKLSGSRFYILRSRIARLQRALITYLLDRHIQAGYEELNVPYILRGGAVFASGQLPKFADNLYHDAEEDYWLIPTAEVPVTSFHSGEILDESQLTLNYTSYTPCFRREKTSSGKDVRGIKRGHQFDKVELYKFAHPDKSEEEHEKMLRHVTSIGEELGIPYRIKLLCTADIGFSARMTYDVEFWAPGCNEWLEVSSVSNCGDFQARRAAIRYKDPVTDTNKLVHTLNGSAFGIPRTMIAIMENYQQADGSILVPDCLKPYVGASVITA